jgi:hypothetical protein
MKVSGQFQSFADFHQGKVPTIPVGYGADKVVK